MGRENREEEGGKEGGMRTAKAEMEKIQKTKLRNFFEWPVSLMELCGKTFFSLFTRVGNLLICSKLVILMSDCEWFAQIAQNKLVTMSNCSGCSWQMSHSERIAQGAHDKRATVSNLHRDKRANERIAFFLLQIAYSLFLSQKWAICSKNLIKKLFLCTFLKSFFVG